MALTETRPETHASTQRSPVAPSTLDALVGTADHKRIGRFWISSGLVVLLGSLVVSAVAALEASDLSGFAVVNDASELIQLWSLGRDLLLLGGIVPVLIGLATYLVPLQTGAPGLAFARGAAGAFWTWLLSAGLLIGAYVLNGGPGGGQTDYVVLWVLALGGMVGALLWAMVVVATSVLGARTVGMTLARVPLTSWSFLVFSLIGIMSLPILLAELVLTYVRVTNGLVPLDARETLVGVMDSLHVAPAVYWVGIPVLGMAVDIIGVHTGRPVRAHRAAMAAVGALGVLSYGAGFLSFASLRTPALDNALLVLVIAAAVVPMLAVMGVAADSLRQGEAAWFRVALVAALLSGLLLVLGAAVSLLGLVAPVAVFLHDEMQLSIDLTNLLIVNGTMFHDGVRGLVLGAATVGLLAALHHWSAKIWGRRMGSLLGLVSMAAVAAGAVAWGAGGVLAGIDDQPAYPAALAGGGDNVELFTVITLIGIIAMTVGVLAAALNVAGAALGANESTGHDWSGATLEWATSSPPPVGNFAEPPTVESATPLLDRHEAGAGVAAGESPAEGDETAGEEA